MILATLVLCTANARNLLRPRRFPKNGLFCFLCLLPFAFCLVAQPCYGTGLQPVAPPAKPPAPQICVQVSGDRILARDLVAAVPELAALPADEPLGFAPVPGTRRLLSGQELAYWAGRHGIRLEPGPALCVERATERLTRQRLEATLGAVLKDATPAGMPAPRFEVLDFSRYPVPPGELEFSRSGLPVPPRAGLPVIWRGRVLYGGHRSVPIWARIRVVVSGEAVVATENLGAGRRIESAQVRLATLEWFPFGEAPVRQLDEVVGRLPRRSLRAGAPVLASALVSPQQVERGQTVAVEVRSGSAQLRLEGRAESGGNAGDAITVRNPDSGKRFPARVDGQGKVVVHAYPNTPAQSGRPVVPAGNGVARGRSK